MQIWGSKWEMQYCSYMDISVNFHIFSIYSTYVWRCIQLKRIDQSYIQLVPWNFTIPSHYCNLNSCIPLLSNDAQQNLLYRDTESKRFHPMNYHNIWILHKILHIQFHISYSSSNLCIFSSIKESSWETSEKKKKN